MAGPSLTSEPGLNSVRHRQSSLEPFTFFVLPLFSYPYEVSSSNPFALISIQKTLGVGGTPGGVSRNHFPLILWLLVCCLVLPAFAEAASAGAGSGQDTQANFAAAAQAATSAREAGRAEEAIEDYRGAVAIRSEWQEGWFYLGTLQYDGDRFADAIPAFQKLTQLAPAVGPAWNFLGLCEFETKDYASALTHLEKAQQLGFGDDAELVRVSKYHLALLLIRNGEFDRATATLASAFDGGQFPVQAKLALGLALLHAPVLPQELDPSREALVQAAGEIAASMAQGDFARALAAFPRILNEYPDVPYLHSANAKALTAAGKQQEALGQQREESRVETWLAADKTRRDEKSVEMYGLHSPVASAGVAEPNADELWSQAMDDYSSGHYADAVAALKIWVERRAADCKMNDGTAWAVMGLSEFALKDYGNALIHLQRGQQLGLGGSPEAVRLARYHLGMLLDRSGQYESAAVLLTPEANASSLASEIRFVLGLSLLRIPLLPEQVASSQRSLVDEAGEIAMLLQESRYAEAFPKLEQLIKEYPNTPFLHYAYGLALASLSQYDEAEQALREENRISPASELSYILLASIALRKHKPSEALPAAGRAVQIAPGSAKAHYVLGRAYLELGQQEKAVSELEAANKINPASPEIHFNLAKAYAKSKLPEKAEEERAAFARLNALAEQRRSQMGNQSYGASANAMELSPAQTAAPKSNGSEQRQPR
jgi:tetratricopeptide (TPR) repeat protein